MRMTLTPIVAVAQSGTLSATGHDCTHAVNTDLLRIEN
jgi:hypothetical protein